MNRAIFFIASFLFSSQLFAGYAYPKPPPTWKPNPSGSGGLYQSPANARRDATNNNWYTDAGSVYLPGAGDIKYPVAFKEATNAANFLAKRSFIPSMLGTLALQAMAQWLASSGLQTWIDPSTGKQVWAKPNSYNSLDNSIYKLSLTSKWEPSLEAACANGGLISGFTSQYTIQSVNPPVCAIKALDGSTVPISVSKSPNPCPPGWLQTPAGCVLSPMRPVTQPEFESDVSPLKIPVELPPLLPFPLPVEDPRTNPYPFPFGDPTPFFVPTGDPYPAPAPRPEPDPYPWAEPGLNVNPSPKPAPEPDPWRLEPKPVIKPKPDPNPTPNPTPNPVPTPLPLPPTASTPSSTPEKDPGLCALFPDILACEKLGDAPDSPELQDKQVDVQITPSGGFGASSGSCPPDKMVQLTFINRSVPITYSYVCGMATGVRPVVLALAWLSAALIVLGMGRKS
jgi:Neisseria meningitidis TspB protein